MEGADKGSHVQKLIVSGHNDAIEFTQSFTIVSCRVSLFGDGICGGSESETN